MPGTEAADATIRRAAVRDGAELARLRWDFTVEIRGAVEHDPASFTTAFRDAVEGFLASGRWTIWVAERDDRLIGTVFVERVDKVPRPYQRPLSWGYVTNVYVDPEYRRAGVGRRLIEAAIADASARGWHLLLLWPSELSGEFYARAGFRPSSEALELHLAPEPDPVAPRSTLEG